MFLDLKKDLESSLVTGESNYIDSAAHRSKGKVFFRNKNLNDFANFDILGLSENKKVKRSAQESIEAFGVGNCGSRKHAGTSDAHLVCEKNISKFFGYEKSLLFSSKNQAVMSLLATLLREQDQVFCDEDYAGLLSDVCFLLNCPLEIVPLSDNKKLEEVLSIPTPARRKFIFADSVAASSGRKLDLLALEVACTKHQACLIVDESCAVGILGTRGAGVLDESALAKSPSAPFCLIADLGLGLGGYGACISGSSLLINALATRSKTLAAEPSFPSHLAASISAAVDACELAYASRALVKAKVEYLLAGLSKLKQRLEIHQSSFLSIRFSRWKEANAFYEHLLAKGFLTEVVSSPSKFSEAAFVRIIPNVWHTEKVLGELLSEADNFFSPLR